MSRQSYLFINIINNSNHTLNFGGCPLPLIASPLNTAAVGYSHEYYVGISFQRLTQFILCVR